LQAISSKEVYCVMAVVGALTAITYSEFILSIDAVCTWWCGLR
jgi:hypothetical protein